VAKQKLDLFEFASACMAEAGATATKIVGCQIVYAGPLGAPFDRIPDYVGCHASILSRSILQNPSEHFPLADARMAEPNIYSHFHFSLATKRQTIHSGLSVTSQAQRNEN
jgi:hypothetical protein